jgi:cytochrome b561
MPSTGTGVYFGEFKTRASGVSSPVETGSFVSGTLLARDFDRAEPATVQRYTRTAVALHWVVGLAVLGMIGLGVWMINLPKGVGPFRAEMYNLHKSIGMTLALIIFARVAWRITHPAPPPPETMPRWQVLASHFTHYALYACIVIQPVTGFLGSLASPYPVKYFGYTLPFGSWDIPAAKELLSVVHLANASVLIALILVHIGAVLHHLLVSRDGVFQRMWFAARD